MSSNEEILKEILSKKVDSGRMSVVTIKGGAIIEEADRELQKIFANIADPNTKLTKRVLKIQIGIDPVDDHRHAINYDYDVDSKLAGPEKKTGRARIRVDANGKGLFGEDLDRFEQSEFPGFDNVEPLNKNSK